MRDRIAPNARLPRHIYWETIFEYGTPVNVDALTVLLAYTDFGSDFADLCVLLDNTDPTIPVYLRVEPSHGGTRPMDSARTERSIAASSEDFVHIAYPNPFTFLRISAYTQTPAFPTVAVRWAVIGLRR